MTASRRVLLILLFSYMICILSILDSSQPFSWARDSRHTAASRHLHTSHRLSLLLYAGARACAHVTRPKSVERRIRRDTEESSLESATHTRDGTRTRRSTAPRPTVWHSTVTQPQRSQSRSSSTGSRRPSWRCSRDHEGAERGQCPDIGPPRLPPERGQCPAYPSPTTPHRYDITAWYPRH